MSSTPLWQQSSLEIQRQLSLDREELTLREQLLRALNGKPIHPESAWEILHRWDAIDRFVEEMGRV